MSYKLFNEFSNKWLDEKNCINENEIREYTLTTDLSYRFDKKFSHHEKCFSNVKNCNIFKDYNSKTEFNEQ